MRRGRDAGRGRVPHDFDFNFNFDFDFDFDFNFDFGSIDGRPHDDEPHGLGPSEPV